MKIILGLLMALSTTLSGISVAATTESADSGWSIDVDVDEPCRARAWVRAPDLEPGKVVQGDVKVKLDGPCDSVQSCTLKLRFVERSWVRIRRQGVEFPKPPPMFRPAAPPRCMDGCSGNPATSDPLLDNYTNSLKDPSLWLVREEERVGFEANYELSGGLLCDLGKPIGRDVVESFAILVPSTLYPPAFNPLYVHPPPIFSRSDVAGSDHLYAYSVDVVFVNGTILQVPAGYTSFNGPTQLTTAPLGPETINLTVSHPPLHMRGQVPEVAKPEDIDTDAFTLEVTFPHGRHLEQGSATNITIVSHQVGPGIERPDSVWYMLDTVHKRHWAASLAGDNETAAGLLGSPGTVQRQMRPTSTRAPPGSLYHPVSIHDHPNPELRHPKFPRDGAIRNDGTTTSSTKPIVVQLHVWEDCYPHFQTYYQTTEVELSLFLHPSLHDEPDTDMDMEEYDWVPTVREPNPMLLLRRPHSASIPLVIRSRRDDSIAQLVTAESVHYLSPEARAPVFVDPASVQDLLQKSISERDALSPKARPNFITREGSDVVGDKYLARGKPEMHYVGDTWLRKVVLPRQKNGAGTQFDGLRVQT